MIILKKENDTMKKTLIDATDKEAYELVSAHKRNLEEVKNQGLRTTFKPKVVSEEEKEQKMQEAKQKQIHDKLRLLADKGEALEYLYLVEEYSISFLEALKRTVFKEIGRKKGSFFISFINENKVQGKVKKTLQKSLGLELELEENFDLTSIIQVFFKEDSSNKKIITFFLYFTSWRTDYLVPLPFNFIFQKRNTYLRSMIIETEYSNFSEIPGFDEVLTEI